MFTPFFIYQKQILSQISQSLFAHKKDPCQAFLLLSSAVASNYTISET